MNQEASKNGPPLDGFAILGRRPEARDGECQSQQALRPIIVRVMDGPFRRVRHGENDGDDGYHKKDHPAAAAEHFIRAVYDAFTCPLYEIGDVL